MNLAIPYVGIKFKHCQIPSHSYQLSVSGLGRTYHSVLNLSQNIGVAHSLYFYVFCISNDDNSTDYFFWPVDVAGIEPGTSCSRSQNSDHLAMRCVLCIEPPSYFIGSCHFLKPMNEYFLEQVFKCDQNCLGHKDYKYGSDYTVVALMTIP